MARITVNETGTQPVILLSTDLANGNVQTGNIEGANVLSVICLQDVTITSSTGVFSWADFCSVDMNKLPTPADNEISMNVVIDPVTYFGNANAASGSAANEGMAGLSQDKIPVQFLVVWNNSNVAAVIDGNISTLTNGTVWTSGKGFITSLAPTASPEAPVWVTPCSIAVDGTMYNGREV
jgi:hypothetical protein